MRIIFYRKFRNLLLLSTVFITLFINQQTLADVNIEDTRSKILINHGSGDYDLQLVDPVILAKDVESLKASLVKQQSKLEKILQAKKLSSSDAIITLIIPGGMLYASYRIYEQQKLKKSLLSITYDINDLSNDLIALSADI